MTARAFTLHGTRVKVGDRLMVLETNNRLPARARTITAYAPERGRCCLELDGSGWLNPRHPAFRCVLIQEEARHAA